MPERSNMRDLTVTNAIISKGYNDAPPLKFSEKGDSVRFKVGMKVYDSREESGCRWINMTLKAYGNVCERISKMHLKVGSMINFRGTLDEDVWTADGEEKRMFVVILSDIEYAYSGSKSKDNENENGSGNPSGKGGVNSQQQITQQMQQQQYQQMQPQMNAQQQYQQQIQQQYQSQPNAQQQYQEQQKGMNTAGMNNFNGFEPYAGNSMFPA